MDFSILFFSSNEAEFQENKYRLVIESSRFADQHGFKAVWVPERHFHQFGGLFPNPSTVAAALAVSTTAIRLRAGSVVLPLNNPIRVAEDWSVVDNLSNGRVDLSFAVGWNPNDFAIAPAGFTSRSALTYEGIETIRKLWRGESLSLPNGKGEMATVKLYPLPKQKDLDMWFTCSGGSERFVEAGARGFNVLTALLFQSMDELASKIAAYREARRSHGHDPEAGKVTLMLHTFVHQELNFVRHKVRAPFMTYLENSIDLWRQETDKLNIGSKDRQKVLWFAFDRYFQKGALFGTPETCRPMVERAVQIGVNEIAALVDFGLDGEAMLDGLTYFDQLKNLFPA